jgi:hypothetical protein
VIKTGGSGVKRARGGGACFTVGHTDAVSMRAPKDPEQNPNLRSQGSCAAAAPLLDGGNL